MRKQTMHSKKKAISMILCAGLLTSVLGSCVGGPQTDASPDKASAGGVTPSETGAGEDSLLDGGVTSREGLPIVKNPVELNVGFIFGSLRPDMDKANCWKYAEEKTGIHFNLEAYKDAEKVNLMFASQDYPDLFMSVGITAAQMTLAAEAGDFVELPPLLAEYAPTWDQFFKDQPLSENISRATDGKIYSLPYIDFAPFDRNLRDQWLIMESWLKELSIPIPETTDEFKDTLMQIKENAGKGSIPEDVIPYYFSFDGYVGGQFDLYGSFGVPITSGDYLVVEDGVVWDTDENGKAYSIFWEESPDLMKEHSIDLGMHNTFIAIKTDDFYETVWNEVSYDQPGSRAWAYKNRYKDSVMPNEMVFVAGTLPTEEGNLAKQYATDLTNYRKSMIADYITGKKDIDASWDSYTAEMEKLGLTSFVELQQKAYDLVAK